MPLLYADPRCRGEPRRMTRPVFDERHPVRQVLLARRERGSRTGRRDDPFKVGLAIEGGGMRGVVSAAMLTAVTGDVRAVDVPVAGCRRTESGGLNRSGPMSAGWRLPCCWWWSLCSA